MFLSVLSVILMTLSAVAVAGTPEENYCQFWHADDVRGCIEEVTINIDYVTNRQFIQTMTNIGDRSVVVTNYVGWSRTRFEEDMTMESGSLPVGSSGLRDDVENFDGCPANGELTRNYPFLSTTLPFTVTRFKHYVANGLLSLMEIKARAMTPAKEVTFSRQQLLNQFGEDASAYDLLDYLKDVGVCEEAAYKAEVDGGRQATPMCPHYKISSYERIRSKTSCELTEKLVEGPLFVELALNPYYYQLSSPNVFPRLPVAKSFFRMTVAGILAGYKIRTANSYFDVYIPRHIDSNRVHVRFSNLVPFAAITYNVFDLELSPDAEIPVLPTQCLCNGKTIDQFVVNNKMNVPDNCFNCPTMTNFMAFLKWPALTEIKIGFNCFKYVQIATIAGMNNLKSVEIGKDSFTLTSLVKTPGQFTNFDPITAPAQKTRALIENRRLLLQNNRDLETVILGKGAFADNTIMTVTGNPKLWNLVIGVCDSNSNDAEGSWNFYYSNDCYLNELPELKYVVFGNHAFGNINLGNLLTLNRLEDMCYGYGSWKGSESDAVVTMKDLPSLTTMKMFGAMSRIQTLRFENVPLTAPMGYDLQIENVGAEESLLSTVSIEFQNTGKPLKDKIITHTINHHPQIVDN